MLDVVAELDAGPGLPGTTIRTSPTSVRIVFAVRPFRTFLAANPLVPIVTQMAGHPDLKLPDPTP